MVRSRSTPCQRPLSTHTGMPSSSPTWRWLAGGGEFSNRKGQPPSQQPEPSTIVSGPRAALTWSNNARARSVRFTVSATRARQFSPLGQQGVPDKAVGPLVALGDVDVFGDGVLEQPVHPELLADARLLVATEGRDVIQEVEVVDN